MKTLLLQFIACLMIVVPFVGCGNDDADSTSSDTDTDTDTDSDTDSDTDTDSDSDTDSDTDTDSDSDGDLNPGQDACPDIEWKSDDLIEVGSIMPFAEMQAFIDQDGDGLVETEEVTIDLCYLHLTGKDELRIVIGALW